MKGPIDVVRAYCTVQCSKYYKRFTKTVNSTEKPDPNKVKSFDEWMEN